MGEARELLSPGEFFEHAPVILRDRVRNGSVVPELAVRGSRKREDAAELAYPHLEVHRTGRKQPMSYVSPSHSAAARDPMLFGGVGSVLFPFC